MKISNGNCCGVNSTPHTGDYMNLSITINRFKLEVRLVAFRPKQFTAGLATDLSKRQTRPCVYGVYGHFLPEATVSESSHVKTGHVPHPVLSGGLVNT